LLGKADVNSENLSEQHVSKAGESTIRTGSVKCFTVMFLRHAQLAFKD
jgi:hypothetical protein